MSWTSIVTADRVTGDLTLRYSDLAVAATTNHGPRVSAVLGGAVAVVLPNQVIVELFDLLPTTLDIPQGHRVSALPTANDLSVVIGDDSGGNLAIVTDVAGLRPVVMALECSPTNRTSVLPNRHPSRFRRNTVRYRRHRQLSNRACHPDINNTRVSTRPCTRRPSSVGGDQPNRR